MKKRRIFFMSIVVALVFSMTSCGTSRQAASNSNVAQTDVVLAKKNFKVIEDVEGISKQTYLLGLGGLSRHSMHQSALADMYNKADLKGQSRAVINVSVVYKNSFFIIGNTVKCIATGTVIEFVE